MMFPTSAYLPQHNPASMHHSQQGYPGYHQMIMPSNPVHHSILPSSPSVTSSPSVHSVSPTTTIPHTVTTPVKETPKKRKRGAIEKRRRDRINNSLNDLRRLVPAAFEKQASAKLEKAEILQMTVEHLKALEAKGVNCATPDAQKYAMEYQKIGFRECVSEVARYLVAVEGLDLQDPLRLRLLSHLQCFSAQRESVSINPTTPTSVKPPSSPSSAWNPPESPTLPSIHPATSQSDAMMQSAYSYATTTPSRFLSSSPPHNPTTTGYHSGYFMPPCSVSESKPYRPWGSEVAY